MFVLEDSPDSVYSILNDIAYQLEAHKERLLALVSEHPACCRAFITMHGSGNIYVHSQIHCMALTLEELRSTSMIHVNEFRQSTNPGRLLGFKLQNHYDQLSKAIKAVK